MPAMTRPSKKRNSLRDQASWTAAKQAPMRPAAKTILAIQILGLSLLMTRLEGRSNIT